MSAIAHFVASFREAAPYIQYLRGKTMVVGVTDSLLEGETLIRLAADLNLLASLGLRLVLVHGSRHLLDKLASGRDFVPKYSGSRRITDEATLMEVKQVAGIIRSDVEAALFSSVSAPQRSKPPVIACGNFITARPLGVIDGVDMGYTGTVRKIDAEEIRLRLDGGAVVLISPLGHSYSGKTFNLSMCETAQEVAMALQAEKLVFLTEETGIRRADGSLANTLSVGEVQELIHDNPDAPADLLHAAVGALENGVSRVQILNGREDGSLLRELFTREGSGTSIAREPFVSIRQARSDDIPHIIALIRPLAEQGILLHRSREYLENHISSFSVLEHDQNIYGCVALKTFSEPDCGELACLVVSPEARDGGYGELLLEHLFQKARALNIKTLFDLSKHTGEWFVERGFQTASADDLPAERRQEYNANGRNSKVFVYNLQVV